MVLDPNTGMVYGVINQGVGLSPQFFSFDTYTKQFAARNLSSSIFASELIFSPGINGVFIFDNRHSSGLTPTLYKVW